MFRVHAGATRNRGTFSKCQKKPWVFPVGEIDTTDKLTEKRFYCCLAPASSLRKYMVKIWVAFATALAAWVR
jgi:hypothetical protein